MLKGDRRRTMEEAGRKSRDAASCVSVMFVYRTAVKAALVTWISVNLQERFPHLRFHLTAGNVAIIA